MQITLALTTASSAAQSQPFLCSHNPIIQQENAILIKADCGLQTRSNILAWHSYKGATDTSTIRTIRDPLIATAIVFFVSLIVSVIAFCFCSKRKHEPVQPTSKRIKGH